MTLIDYYKHFISVFGVLTAAVGSLPLIAPLFPKDYAQFLFPPLGTNANGFFRLAAVVLVAATTVIAYYMNDTRSERSKRGRLNVLRGLLVCALIGVGSYMVLKSQFVRVISIPSKNEQVVVIVGYERTPYAQKEFGQASDWEMLRQRGPTDEEIRKLWTSSSIIISELALLASYLLFLLPVTAIGSLAVLFDKSGSPPNP